MTRANAAVMMAYRCGGDEEAIAAARQALITAKIKRYIEQELKKAPPLTDDQKRQLATLILTGGEK